MDESEINCNADQRKLDGKHDMFSLTNSLYIKIGYFYVSQEQVSPTAFFSRQ